MRDIARLPFNCCIFFKKINSKGYASYFNNINLFRIRRIIMELNTIQNVGITVGAAVMDLGAAYGVTSVVGDTPFGTNAAVVDVRFKCFADKNKDNAALNGDDDFKSVANFVKNPRGAKLLAIPAAINLSTKEVFGWTYRYIPRGAPVRTPPKATEHTSQTGETQFTQETQDSASVQDVNSGWEDIKRNKSLLKSHKYTWKEKK